MCSPDRWWTTKPRSEASALVDAVLDLADEIGAALIKAFRRGYLDVPYCPHPDNAGRARSYLDTDGRLQWSRPGALPLHTSSGRPARPS